MHLSTAYCRCELPELEEKLYPAMHSPRRVMDIIEWMDNDMLNYLEPKYVDSWLIKTKDNRLLRALRLGPFKLLGIRYYSISFSFVQADCFGTKYIFLH